MARCNASLEMVSWAGLFVPIAICLHCQWSAGPAQLLALLVTFIAVGMGQMSKHGTAA